MPQPGAPAEGDADRDHNKKHEQRLCSLVQRHDAQVDAARHGEDAQGSHVRHDQQVQSGADEAREPGMGRKIRVASGSRTERGAVANHSHCGKVYPG